MTANIGLVVFANDSGLGIQTKRLCQMIKPNRILAIDMSNLSKNKTHHFDWYSGFTGYKVNGSPTNHEINIFLKGLTHVFLCETPLNNNFFSIAKARNIKVYIQSNYEFCDHLNNKLPLPTKFLMPSYWHVQTMKDRFGDELVDYLPPPIDQNDFKKAREINFHRGDIPNRRPRFLHIVGTLAAQDRNGTLDLLDSLKYSKSQFDLVIRSQHELPRGYQMADNRLFYQVANVLEVQDLYCDFDALILPRRYGGLSLTTCESLMSGLPVIMTDISPNNELLPKDWLFKANKRTSFMTRTMIDVYGTDKRLLGKKLDWLSEQNFDSMKLQAFNIGYDNFAQSNLKEKYQQLFI